MQMPGRKTVAKIKMKKVSHTDLSCDFVPVNFGEEIIGD